MRSVKSRACSVTLAVALTTIGGAAVTTAVAAPAHAAPVVTSTGDGTAPPDCTFTRLDGGISASFTCTSRPSTQTWHILTLCNWHVMSGTVVAGNEVTGNGTSTADCGSYIAAASFVIDS